MDLHYTAAEPSPEEREAVDRCLATFDAAEATLAGTATATTIQRYGRRPYLLPVLHALQGRVGWVSPGGLNHACRSLGVPPADAFGVAAFYALFSTTPQPPVAVHVCDDIGCRFPPADGEGLCGAMERLLGPEGGGLHGAGAKYAATPPSGGGEPGGNGSHGAATPAASSAGAREPGSGGITWHRSPCLGMCERAPAAMVLAAGRQPVERELAPATAAGLVQLARWAAAEADGVGPAGMTAAAGMAAAKSGAESNLQESPAAAVLRSVPQAADEAQRARFRLLARVGRVDPRSLDDYRAAGGMLALRRALEMGPEGVVREVLDSKLMGRGGAAFPTGQKWQGVRGAALPRFLVCNADESEPGTFKDRVLMEGDPFGLIEAMAIAGFATGCEQGYIYIRGEYPLATERLANAIRLARNHGFLGADVLGSGVRFELQLRRGAGAYICGEEMALLNSLEGKRGEPRNKPPFPTQVGLLGKPTVINNVETLFNVPAIVLGGGKAYAALGTERSSGPKLFCVCGHVARPGVYEVTFGVTLRQLIDLAGGVQGAGGGSGGAGAAAADSGAGGAVGDGGAGGYGRLQAVLLGGAAGAFVGPGELDVPLTFEGTRAAGVTLGSGVVMLFDDSVDLRQVLRRIAQFFRDESCGQCVPCRVGVVRQEEVLHRLASDRPLGSPAQELALLKELGQVMRDASICGLGQTASSAIESALGKFPMFTAAS